MSTLSNILELISKLMDCEDPEQGGITRSQLTKGSQFLLWMWLLLERENSLVMMYIDFSKFSL